MLCAALSRPKAEKKSRRKVQPGCWNGFMEFMKTLSCCHEPDLPTNFQTVPEIIRSRRGPGGAYTCEEVTVTTKDGYILRHYRIGTSSSSSVGKSPVLLWHGLMDSCSTFIADGPEYSLSYMLVDAGYDVWLGNSRGTSHSQNHTTLDPEGSKFWQYSWEDMAQRDMPDTVEYVLGVTGAEKLGYVGHSQGTLQMFAALSAGYVDESRIACNVALAPVMSVEHMPDPFLRPLGKLRGAYFFVPFLKGKFVVPYFLKPVDDFFCKLHPYFYTEATSLITGPHDDTTHYPQVLNGHYPQATSVKNMMLWSRMLNRGGFRRYDNSLYDISKYPAQSVPTALVSGALDELADPADVALLEDSLPKADTNVFVHLPKFWHMEICWDRRAREEIYLPHVLPFFKAHFPPTVQV